MEIENYKKVLVTGCAGFIGSHVCERLLQMNYIVLGIDNLDPYYDISLKNHNIKLLKKYAQFHFLEEDIRNTQSISNFKPYKVIHLASLAGVRQSIINPKIYCQVNIEGFIHIMEECVKNDVSHVVYASSSVYGLNKNMPFSEEDVIDSCNSPYACSKRSMEIFAKMYYQLYTISNIGLRFFTVYGPRGRPDMAPYKFLHAIQNGEPIKKFGKGYSYRDYTYIDDIVDGIISAFINNKQKGCEIYNLGNHHSISLNEFISTCEKVCGKKAIIQECEEQIGDVPYTDANNSKAQQDLNYYPKIDLESGLKKLYESIKNEKSQGQEEEEVYG